MKRLDFQEALRWEATGPHPRERGWVLWFKAAKGHGRIKADADGTVLFVLFAAIQGEGFRQLQKGQRVEFRRQPAPNGWQAEDVVVLPHPSEHQARVASFPNAIREAHGHSSSHRVELLASDFCGCFYCQAVYSPNEIREWTDDGQTALCAKCGIDSVIGTKSGFPITPAFLAEMNRYWF